MYSGPSAVISSGPMVTEWVYAHQIAGTLAELAVTHPDQFIADLAAVAAAKVTRLPLVTGQTRARRSRPRRRSSPTPPHIESGADGDRARRPPDFPREIWRMVSRSATLGFSRGLGASVNFWLPERGNRQ
jgi:hypothetical protein